MTIKLYNTKTKTKEVFAPLDPQNVRMYVCGPTVYDRAHLGNARPVLVFDVLYRLLRHTYGADHVTYVRNFTDVDDKINATALARKEAGAEGTLEELVHERSDETIDWYLRDMGALGAREPNQMPRATEFIGPMVAMISDLIAKGHAYEAEGHVLFAVESYQEYGALSGRSVDDMIAGARVEVAPYKRNPMDFVLWKPSNDDLPGWDSPWGRGRPGWHIECSAMAHDLLGASFDIHGGGNDLQFPHHENEIAQSKCAHPEGDFAKVWMHNEMLQVEGKKMSKSLGNFFTVRDLLDQGVPGEVIRFVMLSTHYRKPMDWTADKAKDAADTLHKWRLIADFSEPGKPSKKVIAALSDDLNTAAALDELRKIADRKDAAALKASANLIGLLEPDFGSWSWERRRVGDLRNAPDWHPARAWLNDMLAPVGRQIGDAVAEMNKTARRIGSAFEQISNHLDHLRTTYPDEVELISEDMSLSLINASSMELAQKLAVPVKIRMRDQAKSDRDFAKADEIRAKLEAVGVDLVDTTDGTRWMFRDDVDLSKLEGPL